MGVQISTDLVSIFTNLVDDLKPYAQTQDVIINFKSEVKKIVSFYNPNEIIPQFSNLITKVVSYTPQSQEVKVLLQIDAVNEDIVILRISNTGVNLARIREITNTINYKFVTEGIKNEGTIFKIEIPLNRTHIDSSNHKLKTNLGYKPYYKEIENKLVAYFKEIEHLESAADRKGQKEGSFLRKVNKIIQLRMNDNTFKVNALSSAMSLSRAQLFRKMKVLTKMSPSEYLLYFRLLVARDLLENKSKGFNVGEAAYKAGFVSKSHFSRSFQKQFGFPPSDYKNKKTQP